MLLILIWVFILLLLLIKYKEKILLYSPTLLIASKLSTEFIALQDYNRYSVILGYLIMFFFLFVSIFVIFKKETKRTYIYNLIIFFVLFLFVRIFISSTDIWISFKHGLAIATYLLLFLSLYSIIIDEQLLKIGVKQIIIYSSFFALNSIFLTVFKIGESLNASLGRASYTSTFIRIGNFNFFELHGISILTGLILVFVRMPISKGWRYMFFIASVINIIILYLTYKRTYIVIIVAGILLFYFLNTTSSTKKLRQIITAVFSITFLYVLLGGLISSYISHRSQANDINAIENAGRLLEFTLYPEVVVEQNNPASFLLFGNETLNGSGKYKILNSVINFGKDRNLHNDFSHILYGTGLIGLTTYLLIFINLFMKSYFFVKKFNYTKLYRMVAFSSFIIVSGIFISSLADGILDLHNRAVPFYALGLFLSYLKNQKYISNVVK